MKDCNMYETICKERFDELSGGQKEVINLLRGHNGDPGLLDDIRAIKKAYRLVAGAVVFIICIVAAQCIESIWAWIAGPH